MIVSKNGKTIYEKVHEFKNFEEKIALNKSNQFEIMSNSKLFTSVLILKEVEKVRSYNQSEILKLKELQSTLIAQLSSR